MDAVANRAMFGFAREHKPYEYYVEHKAVVLGAPGKVLDELREYAVTTGINNIICWFNLGGQPHGQTLNSMQLFGQEVMPHLKDFGYDWSTWSGQDAAASDGLRGAPLSR
jgi:hypothetical protein